MDSSDKKVSLPRGHTLITLWVLKSLLGDIAPTGDSPGKTNAATALTGLTPQTEPSPYLEDWAHGLGPFDGVIDNEPEELEDAAGVEGRSAHEQLIQNAAHGPQIRCVVIRPLLHQLRGHVQWGALDGGQHHGVDAHGTGKPAQNKPQMASSG